MEAGEGEEMTVTEAARIKGISRAAVHKAIRDGRLPARVVSLTPARQVWKILRRDVDAWTPLLPGADRTGIGGPKRRTATRRAAGEGEG